MGRCWGVSHAVFGLRGCLLLLLIPVSSSAYVHDAIPQRLSQENQLCTSRCCAPPPPLPLSMFCLCVPAFLPSPPPPRLRLLLTVMSLLPVW